MSQLSYEIDSGEEKCPDIMPWLLAIAEVVNSGGRLAPEKATQKLLKEWVDTYGSKTCWQWIKNFSKTLGMADAVSAETLFENHPDLPVLLTNDEDYKRALSQWFERNPVKVQQTHQLLCGLGKLVPPSTTSKFAAGGVTPEHQRILGEVFGILGKEGSNDEESRALR